MPEVVLFITGPTGAGKTEVALSLAKKLKTEIISADSRQIYKGMDVGTDKVPLEVREKIPHHLVDVALPGELFTVADFKEKAEKIIERLHAEGKLPCVCGGTGLYISSLIRGLFPGPSRDRKIREKLEREAKEKGLSFLYSRLKEVDPEAGSRIHPNDKVRIIRALEVWEKTGYPISLHQKEKTSPPSWESLITCIYFKDRKKLYRVIEERVDKMLNRGLVEETRKLLVEGYDERFCSMQAIGYREMVLFLKGKVSFDEAVSEIKKKTKAFARRQLTFFKKINEAIWLAREDFPSIDALSERIVELLLEKFPQAKKYIL
ncbi:tRNA (adenosine(37)-N6)-dimethylallyltransferase MiaA [Candidatus Aerophobetes bacterium]|nr:tRNA (adenosine(37)-N6)-dimethylallyltransferase MiaA [Candidatus Aerophobetes bacterium]